MTLNAFIENYGNRKFYIEVGGTFRDTITETLDSFVCNIVNTESSLDLFPFQFVRITDDLNPHKFNKLYVIDNFTKEQLNLGDKNETNIYYQYTLSLMSPTKILEKVILPNRTIIHSNANENKTIGQAIKEMCDLYMPKVKRKVSYGSWYEYKPIFDYTSVANNEKFNVKCPDLSWSNPSLRDVITTLMQYVGCLPKVIGYELSFIDLRATKRNFIVPQGKEFFVKESNSSDSYINTIVSPSKNILQDTNKIVCEHLGFRDNENVFIRASDNLILTTDFPISKVSKFYGNLVQGVRLNVSPTPTPTRLNVDYTTSQRIRFETFATLTDVVIEFIKTKDQNILIQPYIYGNGIERKETISVGNVPMNYVNFYDCSFVYTYVVVRYKYNNVNEIYNSLIQRDTNSVSFESFAIRKFDLIDLLKEKQVAQQQEVDYTKLGEFKTLQIPTWEKLTTNYYTSIEYTYNTNKISGFSKKFEEFSWAGDQNYVLMDYLDVVLCHFSATNDTEIIKELGEYYGFAISGYSDIVSNVSSFNVEYFSLQSNRILNRSILDIAEVLNYKKGMSSYGLTYFDIEYIPFNSLNAKYHKQKDIPFELSQIDTQENGISTQELVSKRKQQTINRVGNNILQVLQPLASVDELNDLVRENGELLAYGDNVIFQSEVQFQTDYCVANYVGSKDYVLQNYFTALQYKYRAYEYIGVNESIERKENVHTFVRIGYDYITNGTNIIGASDFRFLSSIFYQIIPLTYAVEEGDYYTSALVNQVGEFTKNLSILTSDTSLLLTYNDLDNNEFGAFIDTTEQEISLGGLLQSRYIIGWEYYDKHTIAFVNENISNNQSSFGFTEMVEQMNKTTQMPKYNFATQVFTLRNQNSNVDFGENTSDTNGERIYYKSLEERINETLQLEYYSASDSIEFNKNLLLWHTLRQAISYPYKLVFKIGETATFSEDWQSASYYDTLSFTTTNLNDFNGVCKVDFDFGDVDMQSVIISILNQETFETLDILKFDATISKTLYFSLNDTRTELVYEYNTYSGIWEQTFHIVPNNVDTNNKRLIAHNV